MIRVSHLRLRFLVALMCSTFALNAQVAPASVHLNWSEQESLPDPVGLKGMYGGTSGGHVLLAGGSNFPVPLAKGGRKTFHRAILARPLPLKKGDAWSEVGQLPRGVGEGATVSTAQGVVCLGGHDGTAPVATALVLRWNAATRQVEQQSLPELPVGLASLAAVQVRDWIYVYGGESAQGVRGNVWRLNLTAALAQPEAGKWEEMPAPPGRPRWGSVLAWVKTPAGERLLAGGGVHGPAKSAGDYLRDVYLCDVEQRKWARAADMPRAAALAGVVQADAARLLILGGSDGHDFERMRALGARYRIPADVLVYDAMADRWSAAGTMPIGTVGAAVVPIPDGWLIAGGEFSPGLRTPRSFQLRVTQTGNQR